MIHELYAVYDSKAEQFLPPWCVPTKGMALRDFKDACNKEGQPWNRNPEDYTLFYLGTWDGDSAKFKLTATPESVCIAIQMIEEKQQITPSNEREFFEPAIVSNGADNEK